MGENHLPYNEGQSVYMHDELAGAADEKLSTVGVCGPLCDADSNCAAITKCFKPGNSKWDCYLKDDTYDVSGDWIGVDNCNFFIPDPVRTQCTLHNQNCGSVNHETASSFELKTAEKMVEVTENWIGTEILQSPLPRKTTMKTTGALVQLPADTAPNAGWQRNAYAFYFKPQESNGWV
jgi:hypothetical protein